MEQQPSIFSPDRAGRVRTFYTENIAIEGAMKVGIPREVAPGERRVAATPDTVKVLQEMGFDVQIEKGAGLKASYFDSAYEEAGATLVSAEQIWSESDLVLKLEPPTLQEASSIREGAHLISFIWPGTRWPRRCFKGPWGHLHRHGEYPRITRLKRWMPVVLWITSVATEP